MSTLMLRLERNELRWGNSPGSRTKPHFHAGYGGRPAGRRTGRKSNWGMIAVNTYQRKGYANRKDYLRQLADEYGADLESVLVAADMLGPGEDFDGLVSMMEDYDLD